MAALPPAVSHPANEQLQELASALDRHMQQHGTAGPFLLGCLVTLACIAIGVLSWRRLERQREGLEAAAHMAEASDAELRRLLKDALPSWWVHALPGLPAEQQMPCLRVVHVWLTMD